MSVYCSIDESTPSEIASNTGWGDFGRWAEELPVEQYPLVVHLWEHGWTQGGPVLRDQLAAALAANPPENEDVRDVGETVLGLLEGAADDAVAAITDGVSEEAETEETDDKEKSPSVD